MVTNELTTSNKRASLLGALAFLLAILATASVAMIGFASFTPFNPPGWLRIASMTPLPFVVILSVGFGVASLKWGSGRTWAIAGLVLTALSVIAFIIMINVGG